MQFVIAPIEYWQSIWQDDMGICPIDVWRKSLDGTQAILHYEYASLLTDPDNDSNVIVYNDDPDNPDEPGSGGHSKGGGTILNPIGTTTQDLIDLLDGPDWSDPNEW